MLSKGMAIISRCKNAKILRKIGSAFRETKNNSFSRIIFGGGCQRESELELKGYEQSLRMSFAD
jgi:hypothetical protein